MAKKAIKAPRSPEKIQELIKLAARLRWEGETWGAIVRAARAKKLTRRSTEQSLRSIVDEYPKEWSKAYTEAKAAVHNDARMEATLTNRAALRFTPTAFQFIVQLLSEVKDPATKAALMLRWAAEERAMQETRTRAARNIDQNLSRLELKEKFLERQDDLFYEFASYDQLKAELIRSLKNPDFRFAVLDALKALPDPSVIDAEFTEDDDGDDTKH
jgi:hypothetical protein